MKLPRQVIGARVNNSLMNRYFSLVLFLTLVLGGGLAIGLFNVPGEWYAGLAKPAFNPPNWLFGPAWTLLYILIAVAGWRVWLRDHTGWSMRLWWVQMALNFLWTPVFFGADRVDLALIIILLLLAPIIAFIAKTWMRDRVTSWLFVPYAVWVAFASVLNGSILALN